MTDQIRAYVRHLRPTYCPAAARKWFAAHGLSWRDFVRDGIPVETMEATNNEHGIEVARRARVEFEPLLPPATLMAQTVELRAHVRHLRPDYCSPGTRQWFSQHGLSWPEFVREGIAVETLEALGEPQASTVAGRARAEAAQQQKA